MYQDTQSTHEKGQSTKGMGVKQTCFMGEPSVQDLTTGWGSPVKQVNWVNCQLSTIQL